MIPYDFTHQAERQLLKLPPNIQKQIIRKLEYYLKQPSPLASAKRLVDSHPPIFRFKAGDYRIIFDWEGDGILITKVGHRRDIYRE